MRVKPTLFNGMRSQDLIDSAIIENMRDMRENNDPIFLSDLLIYKMASPAEPLLKALRDESDDVYFLHCLRDEWGNIPKEGDIVERRDKRELVRDGRPVTSQDEHMWRINGEWEDRMLKIKRFTVDDRGCIKCNADDAQFFLRQFGLHSATGHRISQHTMEHSEDIADCPDGTKKHVWYWRFKECEKTIYPYDKLEMRPKDEAPKRGYSPKSKENLSFV